jgi:hypothetical protein
VNKQPIDRIPGVPGELDVTAMTPGRAAHRRHRGDRILMFSLGLRVVSRDRAVLPPLAMKDALEYLRGSR